MNPHILWSVLLLVGFLGVSMDALAQGTPPASAAATPTSPPLQIQVTPGEIRVTAAQVRIDEVLQRLRLYSGMEAMLLTTLERETITGAFVAKDWSALIDALLSDFNYAKVWDDQGRVVKVLVLSLRPSSVARATPSETPVASVQEPSSAVESPNEELSAEEATPVNFAGGLPPPDTAVQYFHEHYPPLFPDHLAITDAE